jgi:hypothetical protein
MSHLSQTWHIFKKDARHLWPEIAVSMALLIAFARVSLWQWPQGGERGSAEQWVDVTAAVLRGLIPLIWAILIARVVHEDELVGTRAFWLAKPYNRLSLLTAKVLFVANFLCIPFLVMQMYLLAHAGLLNRGAVYGLFPNIGFICFEILLPLGAIASVTRGFGRFFLALIGTIIYLVLLGFGLAEIDNTRFDDPFSIVPASAVLFLIVVAGIVLHYTHRRTSVSRALLLAAPIVAALLTLVPDNAAYHHFYPDAAPATGFSPRLSFNPGKDTGFRPDPTVAKGFVRIMIPYKAEDIAPEDRVMTRAIHATIESQGGLRWSSSWQVLPEQIATGSVTSFQIPKRILNRIGESPVKLSLSIAVERFVPLPSITARTEGQFTAPGGMVCHIRREYPYMTCAYADSLSKFMLLRAPLAPMRCPSDGSATLAAPDNTGEDRLDVYPPQLHVSRSCRLRLSEFLSAHTSHPARG